jgi:hypothetical protein
MSGWTAALLTQTTPPTGAGNVSLHCKLLGGGRKKNFYAGNPTAGAIDYIHTLSVKKEKLNKIN